MGAGLAPYSSVWNSLGCRIEFAAVAVASEECLLLAWAQVLPAPTGSHLGHLRLLPVGPALALDR